MTKMLSASGGLRPPDLLTRGSAPEPHWGLCPQTPIIGSCSTLAMVPPKQPLTPSAAYAPTPPKINPSYGLVYQYASSPGQSALRHWQDAKFHDFVF